MNISCVKYMHRIECCNCHYFHSFRSSFQPEIMPLEFRDSSRNKTKSLKLFSQTPIDVASNGTNYLDPPADYIPPTPPIPDAAQVSGLDGLVENSLNALGEPSLQSLGLGSLWPSGLMQQGLEMLHVGLGLPWWASIVTGNQAVVNNGYFNLPLLNIYKLLKSSFEIGVKLQ